ncbi:MAG: site-specific integrase [Burkholderiaceae bacterium]
MAKLEGLNQRGDRWYLRIIIPGDLQAAYGGKARLNLALKTSDRREALRVGHALRAEWLAAFDTRRHTLNPQPLPSVTPELAQTLAARVRHRVLAGDDAIRADAGLLAALAGAVRPPPSRLLIPVAADAPEPQGTHDPLQGATPEELKALAGLHGVVEGRAAVNLASRNLRSVLPMVKEAALALGLTFDETAPGAPEALLACLKAYREATREVTQRDAGEVVDTPPAPTVATANTGKPRTLRDVFERWKTSGEKTRSTDSIQAMDRALRQFESHHPALPLASVTRDMGDQYRAWLLANCGTPKTARDRLNYLKTLLKYAAQVLEWIPRHPWLGLNLKAPTTRKRRPWKDAELQALFGAPVFTRYELPKSKQAGRDAAYWVPLLGLYTGARPGELCRLRVEDVAPVEGIDCIAVTDEGEDQRVKTDAGRRFIPVHSELVRLGFLDYVAAMKAAGHAILWPHLKTRPEREGDYFTRWFRELRLSVGLADGLPDFYCFRHSVRPLMRRARVSESTMDKITGHETAGSTGTVVYDHWLLEELRDAVEAIRYPVLALPVVSPHGTRGAP